MIFNVLTTLTAVLVGAVVTWHFSRRYYKEAGADLVTEATELRHVNTIMLNATEDAGLVKLNRNETGEIVGRKVEASAVFEGSTTMTVHESPYYVFPDFNALIEKLASVRHSIVADYARIADAIPNCESTDARLTPFAHLVNLVDSAILSLLFINNQLLPPDNVWWKQPLFDSYNDYDKSIAVNSYNNAFIKFGFMQKMFAEMDSSFRILLRKLDPVVANNATTDITGVFGALRKRLTIRFFESDELMKLLRLSRNTIHNNGVFFSEKQEDDQVTYKGQTYEFTHAKPISFVNWDFLIDRLDDVRQLLGAVIFDPNIIGITGQIPDPFAVNRKKVI